MRGMNMLRLYVVIALTTAVLFSFSAQSSEAQQSTINLMTAPFGTSSYVMGTAIEEITRKSGGSVSVSHSESPGVAYNIMKLEKAPAGKANTIFTSAPVLITMAQRGMKPFKASLANGVLAIAYYNAQGKWFVTRDSSIKSYLDLKGKKVAFGTKQQTGWSTTPFMEMSYGAGIKPTDLDLQWIGTKAAVTAFKDRLVDACIAGGYFNPVTGKFFPAPFFQELLATEKNLYHVNPGKQVLENASKNTGLPFPTYTIEPGQVRDLDRPITVGMSPVGWYAYKDVPEDQIYELTKQIILNIEKFADYHSLGKLLTKEMLCWEMEPKDLHPGAYKAYKEFNLMK
jgi:TRAP transporter TAXI family solute receptor